MIQRTFADIAQLVEHPICNRTIVSSNLTVSIFRSSSVVEQWTVNPLVVGSKPTSGEIKLNRPLFWWPVTYARKSTMSLRSHQVFQTMNIQRCHDNREQNTNGIWIHIHD